MATCHSNIKGSITNFILYFPNNSNESWILFLHCKGLTVICCLITFVRQLKCFLPLLCICYRRAGSLSHYSNPWSSNGISSKGYSCTPLYLGIIIWPFRDLLFYNILSVKHCLIGKNNLVNTCITSIHTRYYTYVVCKCVVVCKGKVSLSVIKLFIWVNMHTILFFPRIPVDHEYCF